MAQTNFAALTHNQKTAWSRKLWKEARDESFFGKFLGKSSTSMIQHITELTKSEKGDSAIMTLIPEAVDDGVTGDGQLEGNEEALKAYDDKIQIDQLRKAHRNTGRMNDQKSIVNFRMEAKDALKFWARDRVDQLAFLTMAGVGYEFNTDGSLRPGFAPDGAGGVTRTALANQALKDLSYASDVRAPSAGRHLRWTPTGFASGDTTAVAATDKVEYNMFIALRAYLKRIKLRPVMTNKGGGLYHIFMSPEGLADLKRDPEFRENIRHAWGVGGTTNPLFAGAESYMLDGMIVHCYNHVFNTLGATAGAGAQAGYAGYKWGANADVDGQRILVCGAQALGYADIGVGTWEEEDFDYKNQVGIASGKIMGFLKPRFEANNAPGTGEDHGMLVIDTAITPVVA